MKPGGLIIATALLAVLGGLAWYTNKHPQEAEKKTAPTPKIMTFSSDQAEGLRIVKPGDEPVVLKKNGKDWQIVEPKEYPADNDAVSAIVTSLSGLNGDRLIDENPSGGLAPFGLVSPPEEVDVTVKGGTTYKLLVGSDAPTGNGTYVKLADKPAVYTVSQTTKTSFDRGLNDLRDKRVAAIDQDKLNALSVTAKGVSFELAKDATQGWQIVKPKPYRADSSKVEDLVRKLHDAKYDLTDEKPVQGTTIGAIDGIRISEGAEKTYYANSRKLATPELAEALKTASIDDLRNKKLFDFGFNDPSKLEIDGQSYDKSAQKQAIIDKLRDLTATGFAPAMKGQPAMTITATSSKQEKVTLNREGDTYYAQRENEPTVYTIDAKLIDELKSALKPPTAPAAHPPAPAK